ncbi:MAG: hypothetical protein ACRC3H_12195 [Lachnospiraceae bacterium]
MSYVSPEVIEQVKRMDLLTYLKNYEPVIDMEDGAECYELLSEEELEILIK